MWNIFDIVLDSDIPLPELSEVAVTNVFCSVKAGMNKRSIPEQPAWLHHWHEPGGRISISCAKLDDSYLLRFPRVVDFIISNSCESIQYFPESDMVPETIRHLLLDQVIPRILGHQGRLVLHASAVQFNNGKVAAFLGESGAGKSTLVAALHQRGMHLITDDCLLLELTEKEITAIPNYYGVRLFGDSIQAIYGKLTEDTPVAHYTSKRRVSMPSGKAKTTNTPKTVDALFLLNTPANRVHVNDIHINMASGSAELMKIIGQTFVLDVTNKLLMKKQFRDIGQIVEAGLGIYNLRFPRQHEMLPKVCARITEALEQ
jgi:energy-coupling factor transporter ATP-binding protein EcfA2